MQARIEAVNWQFDNDPAKIQKSLKERLSDLIEQWFGWRVGEYRNYKLMR
jgi:hypothetical protein